MSPNITSVNRTNKSDNSDPRNERAAVGQAKFKPYNWAEIEILAKLLNNLCSNRFVDRIIIPRRPKCLPEGYLMGEWVLNLSTGLILFSARPQQCGFFFGQAQSKSHEAKASHSAIDLALSKYVRGLRIRSVTSIKHERVLIIHFGPQNDRSADSEGSLCLVASMVPSTPELLLCEASAKTEWTVLARSRQKLEGKYLTYTLPDGANAPQAPVIRPEIEAAAMKQDTDSLLVLSRDYETAIEAASFEKRVAAAQKIAIERKAYFLEKIRHLEVQQKQALGEPDWQKFGEHLKANLYQYEKLVSESRPIAASPKKNPKNESLTRLITVADFETGAELDIPVEAKLSGKAQVERFFQSSKRNQRKLIDTAERLADLKAKLADLSKINVVKKQNAGDPLDWAWLESIEVKLGLTVNEKPLSTDIQKRTKEFGEFSGKRFHSKEGLIILIGRNSRENLELTFRIAKGNDIWLHVRGKPSAHAVICLPSKKTASLDSLLDAAELLLHYSNGTGWGKTEIDYTFKKYVKRIKDSTEASYTHNKTLLINHDPKRLDRLLTVDNS